jgi:hypothetical protein
MKKILVAILLVTYTFAVSGASVDLHYCMGRLIGLDFDNSSKNDCSNCGMPIKDKKGCCNNKPIQVKVDRDQQATYNNISLANDHIAIVPSYKIIDDIIISLKNIAHPLIHAPPLIENKPTYLLNCNFRI